MTAQPKSVIKSYFETGDVPSQAQFVDLIDSYANVSAVASATGTLTSAGLNMPNIFTVSASPITTAGNFNVTLASQSQKLVLASPASASGVPTFRTLLASDLPTASSGALTLITTSTASNSASIAFTGLGSTYTQYIVKISNLVPQTDGTACLLTASIDNGSSYLAGTDYVYGIQSPLSNPSTHNQNSSNGDSSINVSGNVGSATGENLSGDIIINNPSNATVYKVINLNAGSFDSSTVSEGIIGTAVVKTTSAVNAIKFAMSSGNIASGIFKLYGVL